MKIIALVPARFASTRFPGKPLAEIGGTPMIRRVVERVAEVVDEVWVATDDYRIYDTVRGFGGRAVMTSDCHRSGTDRCREALDSLEAASGTKYDIVLNIQGDEPFVSPRHIESIIDCFSNDRVQIATLCRRISNSDELFDPSAVKVVFTNDGNALYFSRQPLPYLRGIEQKDWVESADYYKHLGMYAFRADVLRKISELAPGRLEQAESLEQLRWLENGYRISVAVTDTESLAVDTPADLERIEALLATGEIKF